MHWQVQVGYSFCQFEGVHFKVKERTALEIYKALEGATPEWGRDKLTPAIRRALKARTMKRLRRQDEPSKEQKKALLTLNANLAFVIRAIGPDAFTPETVKSLWHAMLREGRPIFIPRDVLKRFASEAREIARDVPVFAPEIIKSMWELMLREDKSIFTLRDTLKHHLKKLPHQPGGAPQIFKTREEKRQVYEKMQNLRNLGMTKSQAQKELSKQYGCGARTIRTILAEVSRSASPPPSLRS